MIVFNFNATAAQKKLVPAKTLHAIRAELSRQLKFDKQAAEVTLAFVSARQMQSINHDFRGKNKATNVLSFPHHTPRELKHAVLQKNDALYLGDVLLCLPYLRKEALSLKKPVNHHLIHLIVHGVLHLVGYDHVRNADAEKMERRETEILASLGVASPYKPQAPSRKNYPKRNLDD